MTYQMTIYVALMLQRSTWHWNTERVKLICTSIRVNKISEF